MSELPVQLDGQPIASATVRLARPRTARRMSANFDCGHRGRLLRWGLAWLRSELYGERDAARAPLHGQPDSLARTRGRGRVD